MFDFRKTALAVAVFSIFIFSLASHAGTEGKQAQVLLVDLSDSAIGEYLEKTINCNSTGVVVKRIVMVEDLAPSSLGDCSSVILVRPVNPKYYPEAARDGLRNLLSRENVGLVLLGLPESSEDVESLFQFIGRHDIAVLDKRQPKDMNNAKAFWIWSQEPEEESQTVCFRKKFEIKKKPRKVSLWTTADNLGKIWVNGSLVGETLNWTNISIFDVSDKIVVGDNLISAECKNLGGSAGFILGVSVADDEKSLWQSGTGSSWKYSRQKQEGAWTSLDFNDTEWKPSRQITLAGEGTWAASKRVDCAWQDPLQVVSTDHPAANGVSGSIGKLWVEWAFKPKDNAVGIVKCGDSVVGVSSAAENTWRTFVFSVNMERSAELEGIAAMKSPLFSGLLLQSVLWASGKSAVPSGGKWKVASPSNGIEDAPEAIKLKLDFPVVMQFSPLPRHSDPASRKTVEELSNGRDAQGIVDDIKRHGFSSLHFDGSVPSRTINYARKQGFDFTLNYGRNSELFSREQPPSICVYSDGYKASVESNYLERRNVLSENPSISRMFPYQDEPFHQGIKSLGYNKEIFDEFRKRYGYEMPQDLETARKDPRKWLDLINFRSAYFSDGWKTVYKIMKKHDPKTEVIMTHDSHSTLGAGVNQDAVIAIDDVFFWGGDFADIFVFDIYPYMLGDFRYGKNREMPKPRMAQTHYAMAQMRNLTRTFQKKFGFWFETYNNTWFSLDEDHRSQTWMESEMCYTAIANDADLLVAGFNIPQDQKHWDTLGKGLNTIQKVGSRLLETRQAKAKAAFLFPRTQYIQMQEEYWNVAMSFEAFLRAFGELDVIHEDQIRDPSLNGYEILVLYDVKLLQAKVAENIAQFVRNGGVVIADCVPVMNEYMEPMKTMEELFGVAKPVTARIMSENSYSASFGPKLSVARNPRSDEVKTVAVNGEALGGKFNFTAVSPRSSKCTDGEVLLSSASQAPALIRKHTGKGATYLLGFCLQDSYFKTFLTEDLAGRTNLYGLLSAIAKDAKVTAHVHSSNPDVEAAIRVNSKEAFLFVISHEASDNNTVVTLSDIPFKVSRVVNVETAAELPFKELDNGISLSVAVPNDTRACLLNIISK